MTGKVNNIDYLVAVVAFNVWDMCWKQQKCEA